MKHFLLILVLVLIGAAGGFFVYTNLINSQTPSLLSDAISGKTEHPEEPEEYISPISIDYLRTQKFEGSDITIENQLANGSNYKRYLASYLSEGYKIYGLLTVPNATKPADGYPAIVFNHGYIPPTQYVTTERYIAYVDSLARNNYVVFKIDLRGHGDSEGYSSGSYFSSSYAKDAINAVRSLQKYSEVDPDRIGMWGHSMSGNLVLRAMLVDDQIKAGVIWGGAVYSYEDYAKYRINDNSFVRTPMPTPPPGVDKNRETSPFVQQLRQGEEEVDFDHPFWKSVSLTQNINYLAKPIQLNHSVNDSTVNVGYSRDLAEVLSENNKVYEFYEYAGGGHNIDSPYFEQAMRNTLDFFEKYL